MVTSIAPPLNSKPVRRRAPGRPTQDDSAKLREIYLQAALDNFLARGYAGASLDEIARSAKAGKMTFYRQFGSKAELFSLVAHRAITKVRMRLDSPLVITGSPEQVLTEIVTRLYVGLTDPEYLAVLRLVIAETARFPELGAALLAEDRYLLEPVVDYLTHATRDGVLAIPDPDAATMQLASLASGGGRFLFKKPKADARHRQQWVHAVVTFALSAWTPRVSSPTGRAPAP